MRISSIILRLIAALTLLLTPLLSLADTVSLKTSYIALYINGRQVNSFYKVMMPKSGGPYLNAKSLLKYLGMQLKCEDKECTAQLPPDKKYSLVTSDNTDIEKKKTHVWVRYSALPHWLPIEAHWNIEQYALFITLQYKSELQLQEERRLQYNSQLQQIRHRKVLNDLPAITPHDKFNAQARLQLNWINPLFDDQALNGEYDANVDIFQGTLFATGSGNIDAKGMSRAPTFWNYTVRRPGKFYLLRFGDTFVPASLLLPTFNVNTSILFRQRKESALTEGFVYQGQTVPSSEVDVYRNGAIVKILIANDDGTYTVNLPNAQPNDIIKIRIFLRSGKEETKTIRVSNNDEGLLRKGQWDTNFQLGHVSASGEFGHFQERFGVSDSISAGVDAYYFPSSKNQAAGGIDIDAQVLPTLSFQAETATYKSGSDIHTRTYFTAIPHNQFQIDLQRMNTNSPILSLQPSTIFSDLPFPTLFPQARNFVDVKDNISIDSWTVTPEYVNSNVGQLYNLSLLGGIGRHFSATLSSGVTNNTPGVSGARAYLQSSLFYLINSHNLVQLMRQDYPGQNTTTLTYRLQSLKPTGLDLSLGIQVPDRGKIEVIGNAQWQFSPSFAASLQVSPDNTQFQLTYFGMLAMQPGPKVYNNFATGTVAGRLMAPSLTGKKKETPVKDAVIHVGSKTVKTNKKGYYFATGIPTNTRVPISVDANSLTASLIPARKTLIIRLRPGTSIKYNPKLDWSVGIDGTVKHAREAIPAGTIIEVMKEKDADPISTARVEANGFFVIDKLPPGKYYMRIKGSKISEPQEIDIREGVEWISDVKYDWPAQESAEVSAPDAKNDAEKPR